MVARVKTVAFQGMEVIDVDVQVQLASGLPAFTMVGAITPDLRRPNKSRPALVSTLAPGATQPGGLLFGGPFAACGRPQSRVYRCTGGPRLASPAQGGVRRQGVYSRQSFPR